MLCRPKKAGLFLMYILFYFSFYKANVYITKNYQPRQLHWCMKIIIRWQHYVIAPSPTLTFNYSKWRCWHLHLSCIQYLIRNSNNFKSHLPIPLKNWHTAMVLWLKIAEGNLFLWRGIKDNKFLNNKSYIDANWMWRQQCKTYKTIIQHDLYIKVLHSWVLITAFVNWGVGGHNYQVVLLPSSLL